MMAMPRRPSNARTCCGAPVGRDALNRSPLELRTTSRTRATSSSEAAVGLRALYSACGTPELGSPIVIAK